MSPTSDRLFWLLRHAKTLADPPKGGGDHERKLAPRGRKDADALRGPAGRRGGPPRASAPASCPPWCCARTPPAPPRRPSAPWRRWPGRRPSTAGVPSTPPRPTRWSASCGGRRRGDLGHGGRPQPHGRRPGRVDARRSRQVRPPGGGPPRLPHLCPRRLPAPRRPLARGGARHRDPGRPVRAPRSDNPVARTPVKGPPYEGCTDGLDTPGPSACRSGQRGQHGGVALAAAAAQAPPRPGRRRAA